MGGLVLGRWQGAQGQANIYGHLQGGRELLVAVGVKRRERI